MTGLNDLAAGGRLSVPSLGSAVGGSSNKELMADARAALSGNWGMAILGHLLYALLIFSFMFFAITALLFAGVASSVSTEDFVQKVWIINPALSLVQFLLSGALTVGFMAFFLGIAREGDAVLDRLFTGFRRYGTSLGVYFFFSLFVFLWSLLLIIPGIIASFRYSMAFFIVADDEDCGPLEALGRSKAMMKGNKWKFFCLHWRFFGWALLASLTGGIGYLWLVPYMQTSFAKFYEDVS